MKKRAVVEAFGAPPFEGFSDGAFRFLRGLAENNNKAWFDAHRADYETNIREPLSALVLGVIEGLDRELGFRGDPRRAVFRLHRDVRFSADKRPYKTNAGAAVTRDGQKLSPGVLYIHFEPAGCFMAAGFYGPGAAVLGRLRAGMVEDAAGWKRCRKALAGEGLALSREGALTRGPKGFEGAVEDVAEDLKLKSWVVRRALSDRDMKQAGLVDRVVAFALAAAPLLKFGWRALEA